MTKPESTPRPEDAELREALIREQRDRVKAERLAEALEAQLVAERSKLDQVTSRRSVRLALGVARLGGPLLRALRKRKSTESAGTTAHDVVARMQEQRPDPGAAEGPLVSIILRNQDNTGFLGRLLGDLRDNTHYRSIEAVVVDCGLAETGSVLLDSDWTFPIRVVRCERGASTGRAFNQGLAAARGSYVLLLHNQVEPINAGWLGAMVNDMEAEPTRGAVGALLVRPSSADISATLIHRGISFGRRSEGGSATPSVRTMGAGEDPTQPTLITTTEVPAVAAACMLLPVDLLRDLDGFDEHYMNDLADVDLSLRIAEAGRTVAVVGDAAVFFDGTHSHSEGAAARTRTAEVSDSLYFSEKWGAVLSRMLQLERLSPNPQWLHHVESSVIAITVTADDPTAGHEDWYVAHELGDALEETGFHVVYVDQKQWYNVDDKISVVLCLLDGYDVRRAPKDAVTIAWVRGRTNRWIEQPWFGCHDIYIPCSRASAQILNDANVATTEPIQLATNEKRFYPRPADGTLKSDFVSTSNYWKEARHGIEKVIVNPGEDFRIFGRGWEHVPALRRYSRGQIPYDELPDVYASSKVVIDDNAAQALQYGTANSRVFDAIATGALVITNNKIAADEVFEGRLPVYTDELEQRALLDTYLADDELRHSTAASLREIVLGAHTYAHRAVEIPQAAKESINLPRIALKIGSPDEATAHLWGDTHFAAALASGLRKNGAIPSIQLRADWDAPASQSVDISLHIRGLGTYAPKPAHKNILWIISHPEQVSVDECNNYDLVLVASAVFAAELRAKVHVPVEVMYQATDPDRFSPAPDPKLATEFLFVGNSRGQERMAVTAALAIDAQLRVYGQGWDGTLPKEILAGTHVPNDRLGSLYSSADISLNDHWPDMARQGFISNRVFDIVASGGLVFTDPVAGMDEVFADAIPTFDSPEQLRQLLDSFRANPKEFSARMEAARKVVLRDHTFDQRARRLVEIVNELGWRPVTAREPSTN